MTRFRVCRIAALATLMAWAAVAGAQTSQTIAADATREANLRAYSDLLRTDIRAQKAAFISELMDFTEDEDAKFWPIYRQYEKDLAAINDDRIALINEYADKYKTLTDAQADQLARRAIELDGRRSALVGRYYDQLAHALPATTAVQALQVEHQFLLLLDLQVAASLPIVEKTSDSSR